MTDTHRLNIDNAFAGNAPEKRKRREDTIFPNEDVAFLPNKRHKNEIIFNRRKIEVEMSFAEQRAKQGNRKMMYFYIEKAYKIAQEMGISKDMVTDKVVGSIELGSERDFYLREMQNELHLAHERAQAGNEMMMVFRIKEATKHAKKAGLLDSTFTAKVDAIRADLGSKKEFHIREMKSNLHLADVRAKEGNRNMMDIWLDEATKHAKKAGLMDSTFRRSVEKIQSSLGCEEKFYREEMERQFKCAKTCAKQGNLKMMEYRIAEAEQHGKRAGVAKPLLEERILHLREYLI